MKHVISSLVASLLFVTVSACRKEHSQAQPEASGTASASAPATDTRAPEQRPASSPYDLQFLDTMSKHHAEAVQMAKMAQGKVEQPQLKELAARIPGDQQKEIDQMKAWRDQWYPGAPSAENMQVPGMSSNVNMDMSQSSMKPGPDYDLMFIEMMLPHHQAAIAMSRDALGRAQHQEVKILAQQIINAQTKEIDQMRKWKKALRDAQAHKR